MTKEKGDEPRVDVAREMMEKADNQVRSHKLIRYGVYLAPAVALGIRFNMVYVAVYLYFFVGYKIFRQVQKTEEFEFIQLSLLVFWLPVVAYGLATGADQ